jgi:hypothetical protein
MPLTCGLPGLASEVEEELGEALEDLQVRLWGFKVLRIGLGIGFWGLGLRWG